jgi:hypothetical protein
MHASFSTSFRVSEVLESSILSATLTNSKESPAKDRGPQSASCKAANLSPLSPVSLSTAGNLAIQRVAAPRLQRKSHVSRRGDVYEEEADRVSQHVLTLISAPAVQRKCACGGEGECDECRRKAAVQSADIHRKTDDLSVQRFSLGEDAPGTNNPSGTTDNPPATPDPSTPAASPGLIVEDNTTDLGTGQMKKSEFLGQLRSPVSDAAQSALEGTTWASLGSVAIDPWFQSYSGQSAAQLERTIQQSVPGSAGVTAASAYIPLVSSQVQSSVSEWARTGVVPAGVPGGLPGAGPSGIGGAVSSLAQGASDVISNIGGMLFKAKTGGPRAGNDPRMIQAQLGAGEGLDGSLQSRMSSAFGYDFSGVRVHKDNQAAQLSADLNARAFTVGRNVAFGASEYQPGTLAGDALIAHELAHVVQQGGATGQAPLQKGESQTGALEDDADVSAVQAVASLWTGATAGLANLTRGAIPALKSGLRLQRCSIDRTPVTLQYHFQGLSGFDVAIYCACTQPQNSVQDKFIDNSQAGQSHVHYPPGLEIDWVGSSVKAKRPLQQDPCKIGRLCI